MDSSIAETPKRRARAYSFLPRRLHRRTFLKWLRRTHGWLGLWGAVLGLFFSFTGILLNHRDILKIPLPRAENAAKQLALPDPPPTTAEAMGAWLQKTLGIADPARRIAVTPRRKMEWGNGEVWQPEQWRISFSVPHHTITAIYWQGNSHVRIQDFRPNIFMTLNRLHRADSIDVVWVLITDSIAASIIVLSLTGILLWTRLLGTRLLAVGLGLGAPAIAIVGYINLP
jgi:hypothetical protein